MKGLARKKVVKPQSTNFERCPKVFISSDRMSSQRELKKWKLCLYLINYLHNLCAKNHPRPTFSRVKGLARQKVVKPKSTNFTRCWTYLLLFKKSWVRGIVGSWDSPYFLVNYLDFVSAKIQPNRTTFRVKGLATKEVFKLKSTKFTRCSIYSASVDKISSQGVLKKMKLYMWLVNYYHYVCAKF